MPKTHPPAVKRRYLNLRRNGFTQRQAMAEVGIRSPQTAHKWDHMLPPGVTNVRKLDEEDRIPVPRSYDDLSDPVRRAHDDVGYFRHRYFARESRHWGQIAAELLVGALADRSTRATSLSLDRAVRGRPP
jgi:hypothetical protein